jgi:hypothetical protein
MICVKVTTATDHWLTSINCTLEEAKAYFMGQRFERRDETMGDPVISVEEVCCDGPVPPYTKEDQEIYGDYSAFLAAHNCD